MSSIKSRFKVVQWIWCIIQWSFDTTKIYNCHTVRCWPSTAFVTHSFIQSVRHLCLPELPSGQVWHQPGSLVLLIYWLRMKKSLRSLPRHRIFLLQATKLYCRQVIRVLFSKGYTVTMEGVVMSEPSHISCAVCKEDFMGDSSLEQHMRIHVRENTFPETVITNLFLLIIILSVMQAGSSTNVRLVLRHFPMLAV